MKEVALGQVLKSDFFKLGLVNRYNLDEGIYKKFSKGFGKLGNIRLILGN